MKNIGERVENRTGSLSDTYFYCHTVWENIHFLYLPWHFLFVVKCWQSLFDFFVFKYHFKTTSLYWTFILSFCPKFSNANGIYEDRYAIDLQMQVWHMKIDMQLIFRLDKKPNFSSKISWFILSSHHLTSPPFSKSPRQEPNLFLGYISSQSIKIKHLVKSCYKSLS